jgi:hypothetical protein
MQLAFVVHDDLTTVDGTESVAFTPDKPVTELVFRLTANTAGSVANGNHIVVHSARADHGGRAFTFAPAGAGPGTQGGLLIIPLSATVPAGTTVTARITFTLTLGLRSFDRFGRIEDVSGGYAWFGSGEPLLAWQRGYGWHTEDLANVLGESATSEAMDETTSVTAPANDVVIMSGNPTQPVAHGSTRTWTAGLSTARDVSVAVGPFRTADTTVDGVRLRVGGAAAGDLESLVPLFQRAIRALVARYGPFPFPSLAVARLPLTGGGIEYPGSILMLDGSQLVATHETAHQYFYAMVGDSQAQHPWLDEAFAEYSEQLIDDAAEPPDALQLPGAVDSPISAFPDDETYDRVVYEKGAAALEAARRAAGAAAFDAALRCYVAKNAWRIVVPSDLKTALEKLPAAIAVLRQAGALR